MEILSKSIHVIDYETQRAILRDIPDTFDNFVKELIEHIDSNTSIRRYIPRSQQTQVVANVRRITLCEESHTTIIQQSQSDIANRLLRSEIEVQEQISRLNNSVQKGSLVQALVYDAGEQTEKYRYLLAKVEHTEFVDDVDFSFKTGFSKSKKNIWKTCILDCANDEESSIILARIYTNSTANYWSDSFLELDPMETDEINTLAAFKAIDGVLSRHVKPHAPHDYTIIRNAVITYFRGNEFIDYETMLNSLIGNYQWESADMPSSIDLLQKLSVLPEQKDFDRQFRSIPSSISAKVKKIYPLNDGIELKVYDALPNLDNIISSSYSEDGGMYINIRTNCNETFNAFHTAN